jgi:hypothetical protein
VTNVTPGEVIKRYQSPMADMLTASRSMVQGILDAMRPERPIVDEVPVATTDSSQHLDRSPFADAITALNGYTAQMDELARQATDTINAINVLQTAVPRALAAQLQATDDALRYFSSMPSVSAIQSSILATVFPFAWRN